MMDMIRTFDKHTLVREKKIIRFIADHLSEQNKNEARLLYGDVSFFNVLMDEAEATETGFVLFSDTGEPRGVGGICENKTSWFVLTEHTTTELHVAWLKHGRRWFAEQLAKYGRVYGYCCVDNTLSMKWMKWLGFDFAAPDSEATATINGKKFLYFQKNY